MTWPADEDTTPDQRMLAPSAFSRLGVIRARNDLWFDYGSNVERYAKWQALLAQLSLPLLVLRRTRDRFFTVPGAVAYLRQAPHAELWLLDAGHFATLERPVEMARYIVAFLANQTDGANAPILSALGTGRQ